jgi:hypothetical protein
LSTTSKFRLCAPLKSCALQILEWVKNASEVTLVPRKCFLKILNLVQSFVECKVSLADGTNKLSLKFESKRPNCCWIFISPSSNVKRSSCMKHDVIRFFFCFFLSRLVSEFPPLISQDSQQLHKLRSTFLRRLRGPV